MNLPFNGSLISNCLLFFLPQDQIRLELESQIAEKDQEISSLRQQLGEKEEGDVLSKPAMVELLDKMQQRSQEDQESKVQLGDDIVEVLWHDW